MILLFKAAAPLLALALLFAIGKAADSQSEPPTIPTGLDAYRMWDKWPMQRIGIRAYMRSTYDRSGGNEGADASHFLYQRGDDFNVSLDIAGPGIVYFSRYNHWHGSPWHYEVDGRDHIVQETSSADPNHPDPNSTFLPAALFPKPLNWTWADTKGADLVWTPIPFAKSFRMAYTRTHYGTGYYIYDLYAPGAKLTQPIKSWDAKTPPEADILALIARSGSDLLPADGSDEAKALGLRSLSGTIALPKQATVPIAHLADAPATVRCIEFSVPRDEATAFSRAKLRATWDNRAMPSIESPVALFFGAGSLYNRDNKEYLVKSFPMTIRFDNSRCTLACYFPMPYFHSADITLIGAETDISDVRWEIRTCPYKGEANSIGYFHATYQDMPHPDDGLDMVLLNTTLAEGGGDWSGQLVGTSFIFSHNAVLNTLEGDPRFFFDDSLTPQAQGTGTEEWGGGGDYWGGRTMTLPFAGHPVGAPSPESAKNDEDKIESAYRFLLADMMPFGRNAVIRLEHGGVDDSPEHYETVTYWYGLPSPSLIQTDDLEIGNAVSEAAHDYRSPDASKPYSLTSQYDWGPSRIVGDPGKSSAPLHDAQKLPTDPYDTAKPYATIPTFTRTGRLTKTWSEFTLKLQPDNFGVLLRRTLDYAYPNQRAKVFIADASHGVHGKTDWELAGIWQLAGSNTCVYSNPGDELGATQHHVQTSDRHLRDDEFLIGRTLTRGRSAIRVKVKFVPVKIPLFPNYPLTESAWSEMNYAAYCWIMPKNPPGTEALGKIASSPNSRG